MKTQIASATRIINAQRQHVYKLIADYRTSHFRFLPKKHFLSAEVEAGGFGEGTIVRFQLRLLGQTRSFRALVSEPEPGYVLLERDLGSGVRTWFTVSPADSRYVSEVCISTELKNLGAVRGFLARTLLEKVYREELELLARLAEDHPEPAQSPAIGLSSRGSL